MPTDKERREVAARLREIRPCKSGHIEWWEIARALGLKQPAGWFGWEKFEPDSANRLADLIEPSGHECVPGECPINVRHDNDRIDRDALLALVDDLMEEAQMADGMSCHMGEAAAYRYCACRIRGLLGVGE